MADGSSGSGGDSGVGKNVAACPGRRPGRAALAVLRQSEIAPGPAAICLVDNRYCGRCQHFLKCRIAETIDAYSPPVRPYVLTESLRRWA